LITYLGDALQERLPADLVARTEEEVVIIGAGQAPASYRPDLQVREPWALREPPAAEVLSAPSAVQATEPIRVFLDEETERWLAVRDRTGRLITVLELLSPSNKVESLDRDRYLRKQRGYLLSGANLVEIDLVRRGEPVFPRAAREVLKQAGAAYGACVSRVARPVEREVYPMRLRERLAAIRVPLRLADADVVLDLQALIDQCHERRRYQLLDYRLPLDPPLSAEDATWAEQLLRERHLL
jgi:hypothetical protein